MCCTTKDKLVFNICSNKNNVFDRPTLDRYLEVSRAVYRQGGGGADGCAGGASARGGGADGMDTTGDGAGLPVGGCPAAALDGSKNPAYWSHLFEKCGAIHAEIQVRG